MGDLVGHARRELVRLDGSALVLAFDLVESAPPIHDPDHTELPRRGRSCLWVLQVASMGGGGCGDRCGCVLEALRARVGARRARHGKRPRRGLLCTPRSTRADSTTRR